MNPIFELILAQRTMIWDRMRSVIIAHEEIADQMQETQSLTEREIQILELIARGSSNKEIARTLVISINTVKVHLRNIYAKLDVVSRTEAAMWAVQNGLVAIREDTSPAADGPQSAGGPEERTAGSGAPEGFLVRLDAALGQYRGGRFIGYSLLVVVLGTLAWLTLPFARPAQETIDQETYIAELEETRWVQMADMPTGRAAFAAAVYDNRLFAIAGETVAGPSGANEVYDPETDGWTALPPKPTAVTSVQAGVVGGRIFVPGGTLADGSITDVMEVFDPREDAWKTAAPLPLPTSEYALVTFEGKLFIFGGRTGSGITASTYMYDPGTDSWTAKMPMPTARSYAAAQEVGGKIFVIGGFDGSAPLAVNEVYDVALDDGQTPVWSSESPLARGVYRHGIAQAGDNLVLIGGLSGSDEGSEIAQLSTTSGEWSQLTNPFAGVFSDMGIVSSGTQIFRIGGRMNETITGQVFAYTAYYTVLLPIIEK